MRGSAFAQMRRSLSGPETLFVYLAALLSAGAYLLLLIAVAAAVHVVAAAQGSAQVGVVQTSWLGARLQLLFEGLDVLPPLRALWLVLGMAAALAAAECFANFLLNRFSRSAALDIATRLRAELHAHTFRLGGADVLGRPETTPVRLFTVGVEAVRRGAAAWWRVVPHAVLSFVLLLTAAVSLQVWVALSAVLMVVLLWTLSSLLSGAARERRQLLHDRAQMQMAALEERLHHARLVNSYLLEETPGAPFQETLARHRKEAAALHRHRTARGPFFRFWIIAGACALGGLAGTNLLVQPPRLTVAEATLLFSALLSCYPPIRRMVEARRKFEDAELAAGEIQQFLHAEPAVREQPDAVKLPRLAAQVDLADVFLRDSAGRMVLEDLRLQLPFGQRVAVLASGGAAPLALAGLLARLHDPLHGDVKFDGQNVKFVTLKSLREQVCLVLQEGLLFTASVNDNVACGDPKFSEFEVREASRRSGAYEFIQRLPQAFGTVIGEHGVALDAGEALLVGLTRALIRDPALLIVEEPETELGPEAAVMLDRSLEVNAAGRKVVVLARRLVTLREADRVLFFHRGKLHAAGTHAELVQSDELYRHHIYLRFNEFRAEMGEAELSGDLVSAK